MPCVEPHPVGRAVAEEVGQYWSLLEVVVQVVARLAAALAAHQAEVVAAASPLLEAHPVAVAAAASLLVPCLVAAVGGGPYT